MTTTRYFEVKVTGCMPSVLNQFTFVTEGIYTYKLKTNLVKLDGELMTREAAIAKWESKKDTCDLYFVSNKQEGELITNPFWHTYESTIGKTYQLREKGTVKLTIDDEHLKATSPLALTNITADDVTQKMILEFEDNCRAERDDFDKIIAAAYNAVIKNRSEAK